MSDKTSELFHSRQSCISDVEAWATVNMLKLNDINGYFYVLFLRRAHSPFNTKKIQKKQQQRCEHRIRKNKQIKSTVYDAN